MSVTRDIGYWVLDIGLLYSFVSICEYQLSNIR
jgi:hypothetical protein